MVHLTRRINVPAPAEQARVCWLPLDPSAQKGRHMMKQSAQENNTPWDVLQSNEAALNAMVGGCHAGVWCTKGSGWPLGYRIPACRAS